MKTKLLVGAFGALALGLFLSPSARAGTETVEDYGGRQVAPPRYSYAPPPRPVYYAQPRVGVVVGPRFGYYRRPWRAYGYHRRFWRRRVLR
jgi:hypothetical protein